MYEQIEKSFIEKSFLYAQKYNLKITPNTFGWNDEGDAFRHAFMQASLALSYGNVLSKLAGDLHELAGNQSQQSVEENMDKWNNRVGRLIAKEIKKEYKNKLNKMSEKEVEDIIVKKVIQKMKLGKLITSSDDKRKFTGFASDISQDKVFTSEEIGNMSNDEFEDCEEFIDNQLKSFGILNKFQADQEVKAGNLIWVNPYTREDGTEVSGYYRRK